MTVVTDYATLAQLKAYLSERNSSNMGTADDTELASRITAASRRIDRDTGRRFYLDDVTTTRTYKPTHDLLLPVDDIATTTGLVVAQGSSGSYSTLDSTAYDLLPENAVTKAYAIETIRRTTGCWNTNQYARVQVTAKWGWPAVPDEIAYACILLAGRLFRRKYSPSGYEGSADFAGQSRVSRYDPDYDALISAYIRPEL